MREYWVNGKPSRAFVIFDKTAIYDGQHCGSKGNLKKNAINSVFEEIPITNKNLVLLG
jgi:hypothetical protein